MWRSSDPMTCFPFLSFSWRDAWTPNTTRHAKTPTHSSCCHSFPLPDSAVGAIRVHSSYSANLGASRRVLIHIHNVVVHGEDRRFIHIAHNDSQRCGILEWAQVWEVGVWVSVGAFNVECVNFSLFVVQRLERRQKAKVMTLIMICISITVIINTFSLPARQILLLGPCTYAWCYRNPSSLCSDVSKNKYVTSS